VQECTPSYAVECLQQGRADDVSVCALAELPGAFAVPDERMGIWHYSDRTHLPPALRYVMRQTPHFFFFLWVICFLFSF
jgi:hypothetical protein